MDNIKCFGLVFRGIRRSSILSKADTTKVIITVNAEFIVESNKNIRFKELINNSYSTFDGQIPYLIAKIKNPFAKFEKISGSDLIFDALKLSREKSKRIFFLGGDENTNDKAVLKAQEDFGAICDGFSPPFSSYPFTQNLTDDIQLRLRKFSPDILFVGFGAVKQEFWIDDNYQFLQSIDLSVVIGSGGSFAFVSGQIKRAPLFFQRTGLEGVYRFFQEPGMYRLNRLIKSLRIFLLLTK